MKRKKNSDFWRQISIDDSDLLVSCLQLLADDTIFNLWRKSFCSRVHKRQKSCLDFHEIQELAIRWQAMTCFPTNMYISTSFCLSFLTSYISQLSPQMSFLLLLAILLWLSYYEARNLFPRLFSIATQDQSYVFLCWS